MHPYVAAMLHPPAHACIPFEPRVKCNIRRQILFSALVFRSSTFTIYCRVDCLAMAGHRCCMLEKVMSKPHRAAGNQEPLEIGCNFVKFDGDKEKRVWVRYVTKNKWADRTKQSGSFAYIYRNIWSLFMIQRDYFWYRLFHGFYFQIHTCVLYLFRCGIVAIPLNFVSARRSLRAPHVKRVGDRQLKLPSGNQKRRKRKKHAQKPKRIVIKNSLWTMNHNVSLAERNRTKIVSQSE